MVKIIDEIKSEVEKLVEEGTEINVRVVEKNNGVNLTGMSICKTGQAVAPTVYIDEFVERIEEGTETPASVAEQIVRAYENSDNKLPANLMDYINKECILGNVKYSVVNKEKNSSKLENIPSIDFMDLAIVFRYEMTFEDEVGSILLNNGLMKQYDISFEELDEAAKKNTEKAGFVVKSMAQVLGGFFDMEENDVEELDAGMYMLSNKTNVNGATVMLYGEYFERLAEKLKDDLYILPSSIHEVLALPASIGEVESLRDMVNEVNETQLEAHEYLSGSVYVWDRAEKTLKIA